MRTSHKIIAAAALVGLAVAGGAAFTGTGLASTTAATQFVGGTVSQTVTGATLTGVTYGFTDDSNTAVDEITLVLEGANGRVPDVTINSTSSSPLLAVCTAVSAPGATVPNTSTCTMPAGTTSVTGLTGIDITVA
ncbi:hypothetical protein JL107_17330 [Nakamurella flavida]|uniref:Uncharacterized protein n=1 Tax=Nakamurella flavida TaxID=363630 RepID=A0A939C6L1_9ACTN|nr:hypothetical protein [Nakamurella flavida]MBM9478214.1 hypothetical protein [Nakamurella flavida]MDP9778564.1 hypothetical protein [Nakamurella flavida]